MCVLRYPEGVIYDLLEQLGFSRKEADVYLAVLQQGKVPVSELSALTGINRTTVYGIAKELIRKRVIREDITAKKTYLLARPPEDLHLLVERDRTALNKREHLINKAIGELSVLATSSRYSVPKILFADEDELKNVLYTHSERWTRNGLERGDGIWWGFQDHTFVEHYEEWIRWYWSQPFGQANALKLLSNESDVEERMKRHRIDRRQIRFWKSSAPFSATTWIVGDYVILIVTRTRPHYLVEIHDSVLGPNLRAVFQGLWAATDER